MCADAARAHKRVDTCGFHPLVYLPFPLEGLAQTRDRRPLRKRERQSGYSYMTFSAFSQFTDTVLLHRRVSLRWARHKVNCPKGKRRSPVGYQCRTIRECVMIDRVCEDKLYQTSKFVGAVRYNMPKSCATLLCRALRRVTRMCSSTLSDPANRLQNKRCGNPTAVPLFSKRSPVSGLRQTI